MVQTSQRPLLCDYMIVTLQLSFVTPQSLFMDMTDIIISAGDEWDVVSFQPFNSDSCSLYIWDTKPQGDRSGKETNGMPLFILSLVIILDNK